MAGTIQLKGNAELVKAIRNMAERFDSATLRKHVRAGGRVLVNEAKANASNADVTGGVSHSIGIEASAKDETGVVIGPRRGKKYPHGYIAHILEKGAAPHLIKPKKKGVTLLKLPGGRFAPQVYHPGIQATPFLRPAWDVKKDEVLLKIKQGLAGELKAAAQTIAKYK